MKRYIALLVLVCSIILVASIFLWNSYSITSTQDIDVQELQSSLQKTVHITPPLLFVGDVMLGRYVETLMKQRGKEYPFLGLRDTFVNHITIANLEGTIPDTHIQTPINGFTFSFPSFVPQLLRDSGIEAVSLANNHSLDTKDIGYRDTQNALEKVGIAHFGGYRMTIDTYFKTTIGTTTVIVYGINMISSSWDEQVAFDTTVALRKQFPEAMLIAYIHWGNEYDHAQNIIQRTFAHNLIDRGVNTIIGSHPHVVQGVELYANTPIFYSLGNAIFDQYFSLGVEKGFLLSVDKKSGKYLFTILPIVGNRSSPYLATSTIRENILGIIADNSDTALQESIRQGSIQISIDKK